MFPHSPLSPTAGSAVADMWFCIGVKGKTNPAEPSPWSSFKPPPPGFSFATCLHKAWQHKSRWCLAGEGFFHVPLPGSAPGQAETGHWMDGWEQPWGEQPGKPGGRKLAMTWHAAPAGREPAWAWPAAEAEWAGARGGVLPLCSAPALRTTPGARPRGTETWPRGDQGNGQRAQQLPCEDRLREVGMFGWRRLRGDFIAASQYVKGAYTRNRRLFTRVSEWQHEGQQF